MPSTLIRRRSSSPSSEGHRRRPVHDLAHPLGKPIALATPQAEAGAREIATHRDHPLRIRVIGAEQAQQRALHPSHDLALARATHQRIHATVGALQITGQQLHADEPRRARQQHPVGHRNIAFQHLGYLFGVPNTERRINPRQPKEHNCRQGPARRQGKGRWKAHYLPSSRPNTGMELRGLAPGPAEVRRSAVDNLAHRLAGSPIPTPGPRVRSARLGRPHRRLAFARA